MSAEQQRSRLSRFLTSEWHHLVRTVRSWLEDTAERDAEDVVQDVAVSMLESAALAGLAEPIRDLSAYVYRALRNRVVDLYRARRPPAAPSELLAELVDERTEAGGVLAGAELRRSLFDAIDRLPDGQRAVFLATELEGAGFRELAEEWGVPIGTLLARKHRAVRTLRAVLAHLKSERGGGES